MTGYINKFEKNKITMPLMVKDKQFSKKIQQNMEKNCKINYYRL